MAKCIIITGGTWNDSEWSKIQRSVGPYRIASALEDSGYSTFVFDYIINFSTEEIKKVLSQHLTEETLWVGFSSTFFWFPEEGKFSGNGDILKLKEMYWTYDDQIAEIFNFIRKNSKAKIIYGGTKSEFFSGSDGRIDYYVTGLADNSLIALTDYLQTGDESKLIDVEEIKNDSGESSYIVDSRKYPEPQMHNIRTYWWKKDFNVLKNEGLPIEWARGCIFRCKFCTYPLLGKKKGTYLRSAMEIRDDMMRNYDAYGTTDYFISDDTVNDDNDKIKELHEAFKTLPFQPRFAGFFRLDLIHKHPWTAEVLADMGLVGVFFGIETLHPKSAVSIGKGLHPLKQVERMKWLKDGPWKNKVNIGGGIIVGLPHDTIDYFDELIETTTKPDFPMDHIQFYPLHLNNMKDVDKPGMYVSEFNLHPDIYGYEYPGKNNWMNWELPEQGLSYTFVNEVAKEFNRKRDIINKHAGFEVIRYLNIGVSLDDIRTLTAAEIRNKYNIAELNKARIKEYKKLLGL